MISPVRRIRETRGLSRREVAEATGIPVRSIAAYEGGVELPLGRALALASCLGVDVEELGTGRRAGRGGSAPDMRT